MSSRTPRSPIASVSTPFARDATMTRAIERAPGGGIFFDARSDEFRARTRRHARVSVGEWGEDLNRDWTRKRHPSTDAARARDARPPRRRVETVSRDVDVDIDADARAARARRRAVVQRDDAPPAVKTTRTRTRASTAASKARSPRASSTSSASRPSTSRWTIARRFAVVSVVSFVAAFLAGAKTPTTSRDHRDVFASVSSRRGLAEPRARARAFERRFAAWPRRGRRTRLIFSSTTSARTPSTKAPTVLLAARTTEAARAVRARLDASFASDACALTVECASRRLREMDADEARGELQRALTRHFRRCADAARGRDGGAVRRRQYGSRARARASSGAERTRGVRARRGIGAHVARGFRARRATARADVSPGANEKTFTNAAKRALLRAMRVHEDVDDEDATSLAFRRRVDVAVEV